MKALILEGDKAVATSDLAVVEAAHAAGKTFWVELDEKTDASTRRSSSRRSESIRWPWRTCGTTSGSRRSRTSTTTYR